MGDYSATKTYGVLTPLEPSQEAYWTAVLQNAVWNAYNYEIKGDTERLQAARITLRAARERLQELGVSAEFIQVREASGIQKRVAKWKLPQVMEWEATL